MTVWKRCVVERVPNGYVLHSFSAGDSEVWLDGEVRVVPEGDPPRLTNLLVDLLGGETEARVAAPPALPAPSTKEGRLLERVLASNFVRRGVLASAPWGLS